MNQRCLWIVIWVMLLGMESLARSADVLYWENFDGPSIKPGQSLCAAPLSWHLVSPNDAARKSVGNVFLGSGKFHWTGNYLDGATATAPAAENVVQKPFPAVGSGHVVLSCKAYAAGETSAGSQISLRPAQGRFADRAAGWISTARGWDFFVGRVTSHRWPLGEEKLGPYQLLKHSLVGAHDLTIQLKVIVDLDHDRAWGEAQWTDAQGKPQTFKSPICDWDSAPGNVSNVLVSIDKRNGHTGVALDDLRVEGILPMTKPHPFGRREHVVRRLGRGNEAVTLPAEMQWISQSWNGENAQVPYLVYMPEKDRLLLLVGSGKDPLVGAMLHSDDHGKTWSPRRWFSVDTKGRPNAFALGLTYLGQGNLIAFAESLNAPFWRSTDYGQTWKPISPKSPTAEFYAWDPLLVVRGTDGRVECLAQGCWKPTGVPWGSAAAPYSQGYFRWTTDECQTWSTAEKVPQWLGVNEVSMLITRNGDWLAACRTDNPRRFAHTAFDHYSGLGTSISRDKGKTWSALKILYEWGRHHPSLVLLPDGRVLMSYVVRLGYPDTVDGYPQFGIEAVLSYDNGQTWDMDRRYILAKWTGNIRGEDGWYCGVQSSSTVRLPDGTLLTAFGAGFRNMPGASTCMMDVALVKWRMD